LEENSDLALGVDGMVNIPAWAKLTAFIKGGIVLDAWIAEVGGELILEGWIKLQGGLFAQFTATYKYNTVFGSSRLNSEDDNPSFNGLRVYTQDEPLGIDSLRSGWAVKNNTNLGVRVGRSIALSSFPFRPAPIDLEIRWNSTELTPGGKWMYPGDTALNNSGRKVVICPFRIVNVTDNSPIRLFVNGALDSMWRPGREIAVVTPRPGRLFKKSSAGMSVSVRQPWMAIQPPFASTPAAILPGYLAARASINSGFSTAIVPRITREAPASKYRWTLSPSRAPPPTSMKRPVSRAMAARAGRLTCAPSFAPSRSTTCRWVAPAARKDFAISTGLSP
jgi:hypothetical protein